MMGLPHTLQRNFPLRVHIATLFTLLILLTGLGIGWFVYQQSQETALTQAQADFERTAREMTVSLERLYRPTGALVNLLARQPLMHAHDLGERLENLDTLREMLNANPQSLSLYVGWDDGSFFQLRTLDDDRLRKALAAPAKATYLMQSIDVGNGTLPVDRRYIYYDANLTMLRDDERPDYQYDPRQRPWYKQAVAQDGLVRTDPFATFTTGELGLAFAHRNRDASAVAAATLTLTRLSSALAAGKPTVSAQLLLFDDQRRVLAYPEQEKLLMADASKDTGWRPALLEDLHVPLLQVLLPAGKPVMADRRSRIDASGHEWLTAIVPVGSASGSSTWLLLAAPTAELYADARTVRNKTLLATVAVVLLSLPLVWMLSAHIAGQLRKLTHEAQRIHRFEFEGELSTESRVKEVAELTDAIGKLKRTIRRFLDISLSLSAETRFEQLLDRVLAEMLGAAGAEGGAIYLLDDTGSKLTPAAMRWQNEAVGVDRLGDIPLSDTTEPLVQAVKDRRTEILLLTSPRPASLQFIDAHFGSARVQMIAPPLTNRAGELVGVLCLFLPNEREAVSPERIAFIEALSGTAAIAIESQRLLQGQKALLNCFITLIAGAIDAKSPYTGGHCQRVPELTKALAEAAHEASDGPFKDYRLSEEDREVLHIACWLHDCGKVTTPEYVVDKATKLETLYDRIHEIRTRFEVLKRDAEIAYWQGVAGGGDTITLAAERDALLQTLNDEFAFVAECNTGGEYLAPDKLQRLRQIAQRQWQRTLDDNLGLSWAEKRRKQVGEVTLPVWESLLADKPEHILPRNPGEIMAEDNRWGFKLRTPEHKFNRGELHNLSISRGTLTDEERYIINDHIVQTIIMLDSLPLPKHLLRVPEIAGGHHERMDGNGYPKRLSRDEMSVEARMMAIADIFEALTAIDRPYKVGKTLSEALTIMARMQQEQHIDPELFALFLHSGVYLTYAKRYLLPEQIDAVNIADYLPAGA
ncbi:HD domain-containing protein [Andreprevotia lacus DSM 23236]|jgi:HD-GYP domain-containing protein (c-di-GMP phosphodiesterase class II)|uniref:HD domain-containing protein n=1 Tax=Andreprevotia lacus DSM 23236 TaxID=1121001 RepID=A0A1W1XD57_9NEIS|nr:HD domain-containing phosphohydrolase [Andreprevotia lacus]SMC21792.1 HD domain-containing protein [Andreprevotia lacus DSM 23236]